ncbi:MAG TPA: hypothetical protein VFC37_04085 [Terracidiphilus sp.]|nr:hypothetical protein [Terracidiphilus sp.]
MARWIVAISTLAIPLNPAFAPQQAAAQQTAAPAMSSGCTGNVNIVRISEVKPGMMDKFLGAVAAQQAWYKNAGTPDEISVMRVMEQNPDTKAWALSDTQAITTHVMPARTRVFLTTQLGTRSWLCSRTAPPSKLNTSVASFQSSRSCSSHSLRQTPRMGRAAPGIRVHSNHPGSVSSIAP